VWDVAREARAPFVVPADVDAMRLLGCGAAGGVAGLRRRCNRVVLSETLPAYAGLMLYVFVISHVPSRVVYPGCP
jgi:hypothetical protein